MWFYIVSYEPEDSRWYNFTYQNEETKQTFSTIHKYSFHSYLLKQSGLNLKTFYSSNYDKVLELLIEKKILFKFEDIDEPIDEPEIINKTEKNWNEFVMEFNNLIEKIKN